jgi:FKBP-type peptidyl-prolyl cis-trans isomerase 2
MGKNVGDKVTVNIPPDQAYGEVREDLLTKVGKDQLPGEVQVGQSLSAQAQNGQEINVTVKEINEDHVIVDANHPLAGKELLFDIEVVDVQSL